jgi:hypothetical protein
LRPAVVMGDDGAAPGRSGPPLLEKRSLFAVAEKTRSERNRTKLSNDESLIHFPAAPETVNDRAVAMLTASHRS